MRNIAEIFRCSVLVLALQAGGLLAAQTIVNFTVQQPAAPAAGFSFTNAGLDFTFSDLSTGSITSWSWDFGDGNSSTQQNPTHTYAAAGTFVVCLTAEDENGCTDTNCDTIVAVGLQGISGMQGLAIFPNPFNDRLNVQFEMDRGAAVQVGIRNLLGQEVVPHHQGAGQPGIQRFEIGTDLPAGMYLLWIRVDGDEMVRRIVNNR